MPAVPNTVLVLTATNIAGFPPYAARGIAQELDPIGGAFVLARTVNGRLLNLSPSQLRKFVSKITGSDIDPPPLEGLWIATSVVLQVDCIAELAYQTATGAPDRPVVPGSTRVESETGWTFYRPRLQMLVTSFKIARDEWQNTATWELDLEEF